ncbi:ribbon-helix-helix domain-containing protein [Thermomicrobiaceae bacterium CFH 74404]|uniref:Ribbon-helix-helix domain-containing protein n=1 Tax=Thermalbibacter longus TaxID=2951981 RepID=A0AA41WG81_9BACT|nr:ribbon-helix-helix protein, CopG family [Thermalbibacter longus]MCM8749480.1 ribbon-helix-helix domain-containing protein [Thermalbibacter longus]
MRQRMHRTQILLEPEQYRALVELARLEGRSLSELLRELVREHLAQRDQAADVILARQMAALERIRQHRQAVLERRGGVPLDIDIAALVAAEREEHDADILAGSTDDRR